jgi:hypothetical protein
MQASRKHGLFDTRWPCTASPAIVPALHDEAPDGLDWDSFSSRYFPQRGRHDGEALSAYAAYGRRRQPPGTPPRLSVVPTEAPQPSALDQERENAGPQRLLAAMAARRATYE